jgi:hypothetical protein
MQTREDICPRLGQAVFVAPAAVVAVGDFGQHASLHEPAEPAEPVREDIVGDPQVGLNSSKRVIPIVAFRSMSSVQRSPSRSAARPIGQGGACPDSAFWLAFRKFIRFAADLTCK